MILIILRDTNRHSLRCGCLELLPRVMIVLSECLLINRATDTVRQGVDWQGIWKQGHFKGMHAFLPGSA